MKRILVVSTCRNSCCGCLRPPCGGTEATVPSIILSSACWTPSPDTSRDGRVIRLAGDFVDFIDIDDATLGAFNIIISSLQEFQDDIFHILTNIAGFGQRRGISHGKRYIENPSQCLRQQRLATTCGADQQDI